MLSAMPAVRRLAPLLWTPVLLAGAGLLVAGGKLVERFGFLAWAIAALPLLTLGVLARPAAIVHALMFTFPLTSGMERGAAIPFFRPNELVLLCFVYLALVSFLVRRRPVRFTWIDGALILFLFFRVLVPWAVFLFRGEPWSSLAVKTLFGPVQYWFVFRMAVECLDDWKDALDAVFALLVSSAVVAVVGVLQALQVPGINEFLETVYPSDKDIYTFLFSARVTSTWAGDWNGCGLFMAMSVILGLGLHACFPTRRRRNFVLAITLLDFVVVFLTASFTGVICLFLGLGALFALNPQARRLVKPVLLAAPVIGVVMVTVFWQLVQARIDAQFSQAAVTLIPHSFRIRLVMWRDQMWPWVEDYWLWGLGPYRWGWPDEESYYMFLILKAGIFGVLAYAAMNAILLVRLHAYRAWTGHVAGAAALVLAIHLVQVLVANLSGSYGEANGVVEILWLMSGILMGAELRGRGLGALLAARGARAGNEAAPGGSAGDA